MAKSYSKDDSTKRAPREEKQKPERKSIPKMSEKKKAEMEGRKTWTTDQFLQATKEGKKEKKQERKLKKKIDKETRLWKEFSIYIRIRDADNAGMVRCITSGKLIHWTKTDCGHGISRGIRATKYHEQNNHAQSRKDNRYKEGCKDQYSKEVDRRYGPGTWDRLLVLSKSTSKVLSKEEIDRLTDHYRGEADRIKKEKGL